MRTRRKKGSDIRVLAQKFAEAALQSLADVVVNGTSEASRVAAAKELLDRGYGKSGQGGEADKEDVPSQPVIQYIISGPPPELGENDYDTRPKTPE